MYFDLNVPVPAPASLPQTQPSKKSKSKQPATQAQQQKVVFSAAQVAKLEARIDLLVRLGYTVIAFNQNVASKVDPKSHVNVLDPLFSQLRRREGILYLKRLTIELDEDSEKGNGLSTGNASLFTSYDILALRPTTQANLSSACLTHTQPSPLTTHIISIPLTEPRLPFRLKHTLVRTAIKNGAVFEINYAGALLGGGAGEGLGGGEERRNWWAAARELTRVTKGKGLIVCGDVDSDQLLRAPRDVGNLITLLGIAQNLAHDAATQTPKSLLLRAQTRKTYRAILSEPTLIMPNVHAPRTAVEEVDGSAALIARSSEHESQSRANGDVSHDPNEKVLGNKDIAATGSLEKSDTSTTKTNRTQSNGKKRAIGDVDENDATSLGASREPTPSAGAGKKRRKRGRAKLAEGNAP